MGSSGSKGKNKKDFQSVIPYSDKLSPAKTHMRKSVAPLVTSHVTNTKAVELDKESITAIREVASKGWTPNPDFRYTEGQVRRSLMQSCEEECSEITNYLYVGGVKVATSRESLRRSNIRQIINCSPSVVANCFENDPDLEYLTLNMLDGRDDDIGWFICHVIEFVELGRMAGKNTLIHCEKGISRSCSCAIGYIMWASATDFHTAFEFVKERRPVCAPNTGFTCNLIEIDGLLHGEARHIPALFRLASHLEHDENTPVLKICRHPGSRRILYPRMSHLVSHGVFVLRPADGRTKRIFVWKGADALAEDATIAMRLAAKMTNIFTYAESIELVHEHAEPLEFRDHVHQDDVSSEMSEFEYRDLFSSRGKSLMTNGNSSRKNSIRHTSGVTVPLEAEGDESSTSTTTNHSRKDVEIRELVQQHSSFLPPLQLLSVQRTPSAPFSRIASFVSKEETSASSRHGSTSLQPLSLAGLRDQSAVGQTPRLISSRESSGGASPRPVSSGSRSGVIFMGFGSDGSSPRPSSRHDSMNSPRPLLMSSPVQDGLNGGEHSPVPYDEYLPPLHVLAIESATVGGTFESYRARHPDNMDVSPVHNEPKPRLYECVESNGKYSWQRIAVYDDNDLDDEMLALLVCPVKQQFFLWLGDKFFQYKSLPPLALMVRDIEVEGAETNDTYAPDAVKQWIISNVLAGDMELGDAALGDIIMKCVVETQGNETSDWWSVFQDGF